MSWHDLIDDNSLNRFVSGGGDDVIWLPAEDDEPDVTIPPSVTTLYGTELLDVSVIFDDRDEEEDSSYDGITIVSSVPSSTVNITAPTTSYVVNHRAGATATVLTMVDSEESSSLSLHPDSVESSIMTNFTQSSCVNASVSSEDDPSESSDASMESDPLESDPQVQNEAKRGFTKTFDGIDSEALIPVKYHAAIPKQSASTEDQLKLWYSRLKTEQDWDEFREAANELLQAMDCPLKDQDDLIAQLIAAEEDYFWESKTSSSSVALAQPKSWLLEILAVAATVALTSVAVIKILKAR
jgi:hypothetical protein